MRRETLLVEPRIARLADPTWPAMVTTILFLASNPAQTNSLRLAEECAAIQRELRLSAVGRNDFRFESRWAVSVDELTRHLLELEPSIVHFCGHAAESAGVVLQTEDGSAHFLRGAALSKIIRTTTANVKVVVLNACHTAEQAESLSREVDCVVGMAGAIGDEAARSFAVAFYRALGYRKSVGDAVEHGIATLEAKGFPEHLLPTCMARDGLDPAAVTLNPQ